MNGPMPDLTDQDRHALQSYDNLAEHGYGERDETRELDEPYHVTEESTRCPRCRGTGNDLDGTPSERECPECKGTGTACDDS